MRTESVRRLIQLISVLVLLSNPLLGRSQGRGPSTPEERTRAVRVARALEQNPLDKENVKDREWALKWIIEIPDITVNACTTMLGPVAGAKKNNSSEIFAQMLISMAAFIIENPDKAKDNEATYQAGLEGSLKAYESILKVKPKSQWTFLDDLIERRNKGELVEYIRKTMKDCKPI